MQVSDFQPRDGDIIILSSKVISIDEGRCVLKENNTRSDLVSQESNFSMTESLHKSPYELSIIHHALIPSAGIDASNCGDYFSLLPADPHLSARRWYQIICDRYHLKRIGIIIADSHPLPMRWGVVDISIGIWGFNPLKDYRGGTDLFGYTFQVSQGNLADAIASAAGWIMGQGTEQTPVVIARDWPGIEFDSHTDYRTNFYIDPKDDLYHVLLQQFKEKGGVSGHK